ncbi:MAG: Coenzyme F420 hydrogenase/dehydrogenase, beta subunit C-terminal domain [Candidatus Hydrogenedentota bacterium]|nr:MAG: Coenzyme F420 hydrogenase/dehydrogenase, beta subunit C-terminal domain [Candidatus Hydrogenedentota bacterium]
MEELMNRGPDELQTEVQQADLCTGCGMCAGLCPYIKEMEEKVAIIERCGRSDGRCYRFCPRTATDLNLLDEVAFGTKRADSVLGSYRLLSMAKSENATVRAAGQYGGVATALVINALEQAVVDAALLTRYSERKGVLPRPAVARNRDEVLACSGSKYTAAPTLSALNDLLKTGEKIAVVGRPCQVTAVRKMQHYDDRPEVKNIRLLIGLFCLWALEYRRYASYLGDQVDVKQIRKIDIPKDRDLVVYTNGGTARMPIDKIKSFIRPSCEVCFDVTAELADISLGSTEWKDDWNTMLVRSEAGERLVEDAVKAKVIVTKTFPAERRAILREAVNNKKMRVIKELSGRGDQNSPLLYLKIDDEQRKLFLEGGPK